MPIIGLLVLTKPLPLFSVQFLRLTRCEKDEITQRQKRLLGISLFSSRADQAASTFLCLVPAANSLRKR
jgi:hypothetical protein